MNIPMLRLYGKYWNCECNRVLHTEDEAKEHQYQHALKIMDQRNEIL